MTVESKPAIDPEVNAEFFEILAVGECFGGIFLPAFIPRGICSKILGTGVWDGNIEKAEPAVSAKEEDISLITAGVFKLGISKWGSNTICGGQRSSKLSSSTKQLRNCSLS